MDILVTENRSSTRTYRVNDATDTKAAILRVQALEGGYPKAESGISVEENGQSDNCTHSTAPAPKRQP